MAFKLKAKHICSMPYFLQVQQQMIANYSISLSVINYNVHNLCNHCDCFLQRYEEQRGELIRLDCPRGAL